MRTILAAAVLGFVGLVATLRADITVFADGGARLPVYVAVEASSDEKTAAAELARVLGAMSGLDWSVQTEPTGQRAGLFVGRTRAAARVLPALRPAKDLLAPKADEIGPDGFRIRSVGAQVFLEGATPEATGFAVSWLLQRYADVRWYAPGPLGEVIPRRNAWTLPDLAVAREPAYVSREISGVDETWARHNGLRGRIEYSHNLLNVFPPELGATHPEWFAFWQGRRVIPATKADYNWQPDLTRPEVAERAAQQALAAFDREPVRASFSLGMNDSVRFDQGASTRAVVEPLQYFRGMPDYSPLLFGFMNRAAGQVARTRNDRYLGCLAYFWGENVPAFTVHAQVVPYVTTDRTQFYDPAYRAADYALMSRWGRSGVRAFGLWEYAEGDAFVVPRVPHAMLAEAVREGWWRGARGYMGECGPHAGFDAFKVWMLAQLLWEPDRPLAELEDDFFRGWYGPAAEPMRRFFARCEAQWMAQSGPPWWIKFYRQQDQPLLFPPEVCRELRAMLDEAAAKAESSAVAGSEERVVRSYELGTQSAERGTPFSARIALTSRAFAVTEAAVAFDTVRRRLGDVADTLPAAELAAELKRLQQARAGLERAAQAAAASDDAGTQPAMATAGVAYLVRNDPVPRLLAALGRRDAEAPLAVLTELMAAGEVPKDSAVTVPTHWRELATAFADGRFAQLKNRLENGDFARVAAGHQEPNFLYPRSGELPAGWEVRAIATEIGRVALVAEGVRATDNHLSPLPAAKAGEAYRDPMVRDRAGEAGRVPEGTRPGRALRIEGAWETQATQLLAATPGRLHVASAQLRGHSSPGNDAALILVFLTADGRITGEYRTQTLPKGMSEWRTLLLAATAPADAAWVSVGVAAIRQPAGDWLEAAEVELKD